MLQNETLRLRAPETKDLDLLYFRENQDDQWHHNGNTLPYSQETLKHFIYNSSNDLFSEKQFRFMVERLSDGKCLGAVDLFEFDPLHLRAGVGIVIYETEERKKGYASLALQILIGYCRDFLHLNQLFCTVEAENTNSIRLFQNAGFKECGRFSAWVRSSRGFSDALFFQKIL